MTESPDFDLCTCGRVKQVNDKTCHYCIHVLKHPSTKPPRSTTPPPGFRSSSKPPRSSSNPPRSTTPPPGFRSSSKSSRSSSTEKCSCCGVKIKSKSIGERVAKGTAGTAGGGYGGMLIGTILAPGIGTLIGGVIGAWAGGSSGASQSPNICNNCCYGCKRRKDQCICRYYPNDDHNMSDEG